MKHLFLIIFMLSLFGLCNTLNAQCDIQGQNCTGYWMDGGTWTTYIDQCPVDINYEYQVCDGVTYFRLKSISYTTSNDCTEYGEDILPNGVGSSCNQELLWRTWKQAFDEMIWVWFGLRHQQFPNQNICPNTYSYKTITQGGCASWRYASKSVSPYAELIKFVPAPCEEDGCCIHEKKVCWNQQTNQMNIVETNTTMVTEGECEELDPLYNPFEGYGSEWYIGPPQPCEPSCYIWY